MKMYEAFETSEEMEAKGIWQDYGSFRILLARAGGANKKFQRLMEARTKPHRRAIQTETMDDDVATAIFHSVYADSVILAWESKNEEGKLVPGIFTKDGDIIAFNRENVLVTLKKLPELFTDLRTQAATATLYRSQLLEEAAKNS